MKNYRRFFENQRGAVLVTGLMFLTILSLLGTTAYFTTSNEIKMSRNFKLAKEALYAAEAGVEEARYRLKGDYMSGGDFGGEPAGSPSADWVSYIVSEPVYADGWTTSDDLDYNDDDYLVGDFNKYYPKVDNCFNTTLDEANSLAGSDFRYWVKMQHKTEFLAESEPFYHSPTNKRYYDNDGDTSGGHDSSNPGNIVYYGYESDLATTITQFTTSGPDPEYANPVEIITSYGYNKSGDSWEKIVVEVAKPTLKVPGAVYAASVAGVGNVTVVGDDNCYTPTVSVPAVAYSDVDGNTLGGGSVDLDSAAGEDQQVPDMDISAIVDALKAMATATLDVDTASIEDNNQSFGDPDDEDCDDQQVTFIDAMSLGDQEWTVRNIEGCGTLVIDGDADLAGNFDWKGTVVCSGAIEIQGTGAGYFEGALLAESLAYLAGSLTVQYNRCAVENLTDLIGNTLPNSLGWSNK